MLTHMSNTVYTVNRLNVQNMQILPVYDPHSTDTCVILAILHIYMVQMSADVVQNQILWCR